METLPEILLIDKPTGMTSFDVIRFLRTHTGIRKFGHAGTLDPNASGLMILGVEKGTKQLERFIKLDKEYIAEIRIGESRTTDDLEGRVTEEVEVGALSRAEIEAALRSLEGTVCLPVSVYSAIKKDGKPLYKKAREAEKKGEVFSEAPVRDMVVYACELIDEKGEHIEGKARHIVIARFHVGSGTYIRSLAKELGRKLGYPATLQALRRTKIGQHDVAEARTLASFT